MSGRYPQDAAGHKGRDTGIAAASLQNRTLKSLRALVLDEFDHGPGNPEAIAERLADKGHPVWPMTIRCRVSDLGKLGLLVDTGLRAPSMSGRAKSIVWRKAEPAEVAAFRAAAEADQ